MCIRSYQSFTLFHIQTSSSSTYQPPVWLMLFLCICSHSLELIASQRSFLWHLRTFYFQSAFPGTPSDPLPRRLRFSFWHWHFINSFTYLLTSYCVCVYWCIECSLGRFGPSCRHKCHCMYDEPCDVTDGLCATGCADRWLGPSCQTGTYLDCAVCILCRATFDWLILRESSASPNLVGDRAAHPVCDLMLIVAPRNCGLDTISTSPQWQLACCNWVA